MLTELLLPAGAGLTVEATKVEEQQIIIQAKSRQREGWCPYCGQGSKRVHSYYTRTVADLPWAEKAVRFELEVQRFFCDNRACSVKTFAERFPSVVVPYGRRTRRLAARQRQTALAMGGQGGARLTGTWTGPTSRDSLLRLIRSGPVEPVRTPRVLGVDDWAWRKGQVYGTILIDLEAQQVIDLLPERSADSLAAWLQAHPGVEIICRDRGKDYIEGATKGAPAAQQVADRWHLLQNLRETLEQILDQHPASLYAAAVAPPAATAAPSVAPPEPAGDELVSPTGLTRPDQKRQATRQKRLARYEAVVALHQQGVPHRAIARQLGLGRQTVRRYIEAGHFPEMGQRRPGPTILDSYLPYLRTRWAEGMHNGSQLFREIKDQGYAGSRSQLGHWVAGQRRAEPEVSAPASPPSPAKSAQPRPWSARYAVWLLLKPATQLSAEHRLVLKRILQASPAVARAYRFAQAFARIIRARFAKALVPWLQAASQADLKPLQRFANGLQRDYSAVHAALTLTYSNGPTEGHINRLKLIKRQMFGRANFDLLRLRVLAAG